MLRIRTVLVALVAAFGLFHQSALAQNALLQVNYSHDVEYPIAEWVGYDGGDCIGMATVPAHWQEALENDPKIWARILIKYAGEMITIARFEVTAGVWCAYDDMLNRDQQHPAPPVPSTPAEEPLISLNDGVAKRPPLSLFYTAK